jgi:AraC-like DNA-binding protein
MGILLAILCLIGACILIANRIKNTVVNIFLALYFFLHAIQFLSNLLIIKNLSFSNYLFVNLWPFSMLIGPVLYFYVKTITNGVFKFSLKNLFHFLPFIASYIIFIPYFQLSPETKGQIWHEIIEKPIQVLFIDLGFMRSYVFFIARSLHVLFYIFLAKSYFIDNQNQFNTYSPFQKSILIRWINAFLNLSFLFQINSLAFWGYSLFINRLDIVSPLTFWTAAPIGILCIYLFINPYILYGFIQIRYYSNDSWIAKLYSLHKIEEAKPIPEKNELTDINTLVENCICFRIPGLTIRQLAIELDIPLAKLTSHFKYVSKETFNTWKNRRRIEYAIKEINEGYLKKSTLEELAKESGYLSRSNFNQNFQKIEKRSLKRYIANQKLC